MKTVLLLGALGMLGHKVWQQLAAQHNVIACIHGSVPLSLKSPGSLPKGAVLENVDLSENSTLQSLFNDFSPNTVVNCAGILTQPSDSKEMLNLLKINAELPHQLAVLCSRAAKKKCKLIHISSDGVFSGRIGNYSEDDQTDAVDYYGMSKILGEVKEPGLNIRTSIIGFQISQPKGLLEWLFSQRGKAITGFDGYTFSGLTTNALARTIAEIIASQGEMEGTVHIGSKKITKYELLNRLNNAFSLDCHIERSSQASPTCPGKTDRSLDSSRFYRESGLAQPEWDDMINELTEDWENYRNRDHFGCTNSLNRSGERSNA